MKRLFLVLLAVFTGMTLAVPVLAQQRVSLCVDGWNTLSWGPTESQLRMYRSGYVMGAMDALGGRLGPNAPREMNLTELVAAIDGRCHREPYAKVIDVLRWAAGY